MLNTADKMLSILFGDVCIRIIEFLLVDMSPQNHQNGRIGGGGGNKTATQKSIM